jgi:tripartite-type tricarboxylate transporter receptor subunit TctC
MGWAAFLALLLVASAFSAGAQNYPTQTIRLIVPFPAGGPSDIVARLIGQKMSEGWGQPVVIENRPGANTIIGAQAAAKAAPDGYTLFMAIDSSLVMNQYLHKNLPYDPLNDFAPITLTAKTISVLTVAASGPKSVKELIAKAKAEPGKLNYGAGTITAQLMGRLFHKAAGLDIVYVPFKGTPEALTETMTGRVTYFFSPISGALQHIREGKIKQFFHDYFHPCFFRKRLRS